MREAEVTLAFQLVARWFGMVVERCTLVLDDERWRWYSPQEMRWTEELRLVGPLLVAGRFDYRDLNENGEFGACTDFMIVNGARRDRAPSTLAP